MKGCKSSHTWISMNDKLFSLFLSRARRVYTVYTGLSYTTFKSSSSSCKDSSFLKFHWLLSISKFKLVCVIDCGEFTVFEAFLNEFSERLWKHLRHCGMCKYCIYIMNQSYLLQMFWDNLSWNNNWSTSFQIHCFTFVLAIWKVKYELYPSRVNDVI